MMPRMGTSPSTQPDEAHAAEAAKQAEIAAEVEASAAQKTDEPPQIAGTPAIEETTVDEVVAEQPPVQLRPKAGVELDFPIRVSVVGVEDELTFDGPDTTVEVPREVAEQITYSPVIEVAE